MAKIKLTCIKCSKSSNGGFVLTLQNKESKTKETPFGKKIVNKQTTYYMKVEDACKVGKKAELDTDEFDIMPREFELPEDAGDDAGKVVELKWLQLK